MTATFQDIQGWFRKGVAKGATHMIVACDSYDYTNYPVYVQPGTQVADEVKRVAGESMQRIDEVYALWKPQGPQMAARRVRDLSYPDPTED